MEKMREEFEAWIGEYFNGASIERRAHGYNDLLSDALWISWKASRAAMCVELPDNLNGEYYADGWNACLEFVEGALEDTGVSYK